MALSNKQHSLLQHGDKFDTPGSDVLLFFSGIQPAIVGYNGMTDNAKANQNKIWKYPASDKGPTHAVVTIAPRRAQPNLKEIIDDPLSGYTLCEFKKDVSDVSQ